MSDVKRIIVNVVDTETTGLSGPPKGDIVEIAVTPVSFEIGDDGYAENVKVHATIDRLCDPGMQIPIETLVIHHITDEMVKEQAPAAVIKGDFSRLECDYWLAHNAVFDKKFLPDFKQPWLCSLQLARVCFPNAKKYNNQYLRYWSGIYRKMDPERCEPAHRAGPDTYMTAVLFAYMLNIRRMPFEDMVTLCTSIDTAEKVANPSGGPTKGPAFGKHKGKKWSQVPLDYLKWANGSWTGPVADDVRIELERRSAVTKNDPGPIFQMGKVKERG